MIESSHTRLEQLICQVHGVPKRWTCIWYWNPRSWYDPLDLDDYNRTIDLLYQHGLEHEAGLERDDGFVPAQWNLRESWIFVLDTDMDQIIKLTRQPHE